MKEDYDLVEGHTDVIQCVCEIDFPPLAPVTDDIIVNHMRSAQQAKIHQRQHIIFFQKHTHTHTHTHTVRGEWTTCMLSRITYKQTSVISGGVMTSQ